MKSLQKRRLRPFLRKHSITISIVILACIVTAIFVYTMVQAKEAQIQQIGVDNSTSLSKLEVSIKEIKARKAAEEKARKEAEAKVTAAAVINPSTQNGTINSSSCNVSNKHANPTQIDVLVNKKHCIQPVSFAPTDLMTAYGATLSAKAIEQFKAMYQAAAAAGQGFSVTSSYRSYNDQVNTYNYWVGVSGADGADTYSARPGYSEHQTGFVIDVARADGSAALNSFGGTSEYGWLQANAATYGFIQRYYSGYESVTGYTAEEWHYRYVGTAVAQDMKAKSIKTLEQYWNLPGGTY